MSETLSATLQHCDFILEYCSSLNSTEISYQSIHWSLSKLWWTRKDYIYSSKGHTRKKDTFREKRHTKDTCVYIRHLYMNSVKDIKKTHQRHRSLVKDIDKRQDIKRQDTKRQIVKDKTS